MFLKDGQNGKGWCDIDDTDPNILVFTFGGITSVPILVKIE